MADIFNLKGRLLAAIINLPEESVSDPELDSEKRTLAKSIGSLVVASITDPVICMDWLKPNT
jgi:hypothetical protein